MEWNGTGKVQYTKMRGTFCSSTEAGRTLGRLGQFGDAPDERAVQLLVLGEPAVDLNETRAGLQFRQNAEARGERGQSVREAHATHRAALLCGRVHGARPEVLLDAEQRHPLGRNWQTDRDLRTRHVAHLHVRAARAHV